MEQKKYWGKTVASFFSRTVYDAAGTCTHENNGVGVSHETMINGIDIKDIPVAELKAMTGSRPEYLIMPATFGVWMMFMVVYLFNTRSGCHAYNWLQKVLFRGKRHETVIR